MFETSQWGRVIYVLQTHFLRHYQNSVTPIMRESQTLTHKGPWHYRPICSPLYHRLMDQIQYAGGQGSMAGLGQWAVKPKRTEEWLTADWALTSLKCPYVHFQVGTSSSSLLANSETELVTNSPQFQWLTRTQACLNSQLINPHQDDLGDMPRWTSNEVHCSIAMLL